jgi:hypothetical protein
LWGSWVWSALFFERGFNCSFWMLIFMILQRYKLRWSFVILALLAVTGVFVAGLQRLSGCSPDDHPTPDSGPGGD